MITQNDAPSSVPMPAKVVSGLSNSLLRIPGGFIKSRNPSSSSIHTTSRHRPTKSMPPLTPTPSIPPANLPVSSSNSTVNNNNGFYTLRFVISIAILSFLLGSFIRSLMSPTDFFVTPVSDKLEEALLDAIDPNRRMRRTQRLLQLRFWTFDLIVAAVHRR
jgi:hypothetical protein